MSIHTNAFALLAMEAGAAIGLAAVALVVGVIIGATIVSSIRGRTISKARAEADQLRAQAETEARNLTQKAQLDAEKLVLEKRQAFETEAENARREIRETEKRLTKREDLLDKKLESLEEKEKQLTRQTDQLRSREETLARKTTELDETLRQQKEKLLQIADMSVEQARKELLIRVEEDSRLEMAKVTAKIVEEATNEAKA
jgi:ribonuclease Y